MTSTERRKVERVHLQHNPRVLERDSLRPLGTLGDISAEGLMVHCDESLPVGQKMVLRIALPAALGVAAEYVDVTAQVRWSEPSEEGWRAGVYFRFLGLKMDLIIRELIARYSLVEP